MVLVLFCHLSQLSIVAHGELQPDLHLLLVWVIVSISSSSHWLIKAKEELLSAAVIQGGGVGVSPTRGQETLGKTLKDIMDGYNCSLVSLQEGSKTKGYLALIFITPPSVLYNTTII